MRVSDKEVLRMSLPIHFTGEEQSEAGKASGVVIQHLVTEIEIAALPGNLPSFLEVDLSGLELGGIIMLSEIQLPEGVAIPALSEEGTGDVMIANTVHIKESQGTGAAAEAEAEAEALADLEPTAVDDAEDDESGDSEEDRS
jgi:large subunit ribosomal protein L25